ncbi:MAG: hypothetical protein ABI551_22880 [Polyangiaceae bacterium]
MSELGAGLDALSGRGWLEVVGTVCSLAPLDSDVFERGVTEYNRRMDVHLANARG